MNPAERSRLSVSWSPLSQDVLADWRILQSAGGIDTPFLSHQWMSALVDVPAVSSRIKVLRVADRSRTLGLLPLEALDEGGVRVLALPGGAWLGPDHMDVVAAPEDRATAGKAVVRFLNRRGPWDLLDLEGLRGDGAVLTALLTESGPRTLTLPNEVISAPFTELRGVEPSELFRSRNLRQQVQRGLRTAERSGGGFRVSGDPDEVPALLITLMDLHQARFGSRSAVFATTARREFHLRAARRLAGDGMARIYWLDVGGEPAALLYALRLGSRLYYYSMGMQPDLGLSPGRTLLGQTVQHAAQEGLSELDLLRGDHDFKMLFASGVREDARVRRLRLTHRGLLFGVRRVLRRRPSSEAPSARPGQPREG